MQVHLVDGTYELFRYYFALPSHVTANGEEVGATRGAVGTVLQILEQGATHVGVATDHVIESFRNDLWPTYKSSAGVARELLAQFTLFEEALEAAGVVVFAMVEFEADDALAAAAHRAAADERVEQVIICTPDKDLGQCVVGDRIVQLDRRKQVVFDEEAVTAKFGVPPASIPDYLALVGDAADGFPGITGFGAKSAAAVLARWGHIEAIPAQSTEWDAPVRNAGRLALNLRENLDQALLFRRIATVELDAPTFEKVDELAWSGPTPAFVALCERLEAPGLLERAVKLAKPSPLRPADLWHTRLPPSRGRPRIALSRRGRGRGRGRSRRAATCTASSTWSSRTTQEMRMADVEIISMLMPWARQRLEDLGGHAGVRLHARADDAHPGDGVVGRDVAGAQLADAGPGHGHGLLGLVAGHRERDVGVALERRVLHDHVDVDVLVGQRPEQPAGDARPVGHAGQRHLGLVGVVGDGGDDRLLHGGLLGGVGVEDERARLPREGGAHVQRDAVVAGVLDRPHRRLGAAAWRSSRAARRS